MDDYNALNERIEDSVFFMTAFELYDLNGKENKIRRAKNKIIEKMHRKDTNRVKQLLKKYHISMAITERYIITRNGTIEFRENYDRTTQQTKFEPKPLGEHFKDYEKSVNDAIWCIYMKHSLYSLFDSNIFNIDVFFELESFVVRIKNKDYQIDSRACFFNDMPIVLFEVLDIETRKTIPINKIFGSENHFNLVKVDGVQYFDENIMKECGQLISKLIMNNILEFMEAVLHRNIKREWYWINNLLVYSNNIASEQVNEYCLNVLGDSRVDFSFTNLNTKDSYNYYSIDYMGLAIKNKDDVNYRAFYDFQILESLKMYVLLKQKIALAEAGHLKEIVDFRFKLDRLTCVSDVSIITLNYIKNIKRLESYIHSEELIDFKISYLKLIQERKQIKNTKLMNILLYILAVIGGGNSICQFLGEKKTLLFVCVFVVLGIFWFVREDHD